MTSLSSPPFFPKINFLLFLFPLYMESRFAILADIHSNLEALNAVLKDARSQSVTNFFCLGDIVGYNANPQECLNIIMDLEAPTVCGNHDFYCSCDKPLDDFQPNAAAVIEWTRRQINEKGLQWLSSLPLKKTFFQQSFSIVHGTLDNPDQWGYLLDSYDAEASFSYQQTSICFHGHTHIPIIFEKQGRDVHAYENPSPGSRISLNQLRKYTINVGSVGQPRDEIPDASYLIFEPRSRIIEYRRIPYDVETAADKVRAAGLPDRLAERLKIGR